MFDTLLITDLLLIILTSFNSCFVTYFKIEHQCKTYMSLFSFITDIKGFFEIPTPLILEKNEQKFFC